jgi:hypothetical protein
MLVSRESTSQSRKRRCRSNADSHASSTQRALTMNRMLSVFLISIAACIACSERAHAWGDEGHRIVALIAYEHLDAAAKARLDALLKRDTDPLTTHDIASEATWADKLRDSDAPSAKAFAEQTAHWHYADIALASADLDAACYQHPPLPKATLASQGPAKDCVVDKIDQFIAELKSPNTSRAERLLALKFVLHFVGDLHQPLHASDDDDRGGNTKQVVAAGIEPGNLHHYWDTEFVRRLGRDPAAVARTLERSITPRQVAIWSGGTTADWAKQSFDVSRTSVYGTLPAPDADGQYRLPAPYIDLATQTVRQRLSRAGVRLATVLNRALG